MSAAEPDPSPETQPTVKAWLRKRREDLGMSQELLAQAIGVDVKTVKNAEHPQKGLPRGLPFYLMLRELGALRDPPVAEPTVLDRLASLEATLQDGRATLSEMMARLATAIMRLEERLDDGADRGRGAR